MKLPPKHNLYEINKHITRLFEAALEVNQAWSTSHKDIEKICNDNLRNLKKISATVIHLELAIDEVLKAKIKHE